MTTIVKAATAAEFLSFVPRMLGYVPTDSVVLIPFQGTRTLGAMRIDLPAVADTDAAAATYVGLVCRIEAADALAVVVFTDERFDGGSAPARALAEGIRARADSSGLRVVDMLCRASDGWASYLDADTPPGGRPLPEILDADASPADRAGLPLADGDQWTGAALPAVDLAEKERVGNALQAIRVAIGGFGSSATGSTARIDPRGLEAVCLLDDLPALFEEALSWNPEMLDPFDAALLLWCLERPATRDVALVQWCDDIDRGDEAMAAQLRWEAGEPYPAEVAKRMWGEGAQPSAERLRGALEVTRRVAAAAPRATRPGPLAVCAWLSWALGRSTHAEWFVGQAAAIDPTHGLTGIVQAMVRSGHLPEWAFARTGVWRPEDAMGAAG
ncbi:DUF4192 family protein [Microbacterium sp. ET2]|uniref:DUF4192 family protein n=1 Tax=Microbacterium albipurpureum TaxID=3050384 RepID=UPI00259CD809|nr:DUF4192 family protein [Microbacterium sp. ET2 (Ac-2212)]WJL97080.1 DUF4192 family protein [Microbacterium sp. ET2 (Ac-2212)]